MIRKSISSELIRDVSIIEQAGEIVID